ncbi:MAG: divergent polysaccharide deacetylase family protein [Pseudomonadota bacterium]
MAGKWKQRKGRKEAAGGSYFGGFLKGALAGGFMVSAGLVALAYLLPPQQDAAGPGALSLRDDGIEDASDREAQARSGPRSTGSFAEASSAPAIAEVAAAPTVAAPSVNRPAGGLAPAGSPSAPEVGNTASSGLSFTIGGRDTARPEPVAPGPIMSAGAGLGAAPASPGGGGLQAPAAPGGGAFGVPSPPPAGEGAGPDGGASPAGGGALAQPAPDSMAPDSMAPDSMAPDSMAPETASPEAMSPETMSPETMSPEEARAALAALESEDAAAADPTIPALDTAATDTVPGPAAGLQAPPLDPGRLSPEQARAALAALEEGEPAAAVEETPVVPADTPLQVAGLPSGTLGDTAGDTAAAPSASAPGADDGVAVVGAEDVGADSAEAGAGPEETAVASLDPAEATADDVSDVRTIYTPPPRRPVLDPDAVFEAGGDAFAANARAFDLAEGVRPMAVILRATPGVAIDGDTLSSIDLPLTLALQGAAGSETALARSAHDAGIEVVIEMAAPTGEALARLPVAVAAMAAPGSAPDAEMADMLGRYGLGYVDPRSVGNASALRAARQAGVLATSVDRSTPEEAGEADLYRALQVAAGVARRQGSAVLVLPATPEALRAAMQWQLERGLGGEVSLAPLSTVMRARQG